MPCLIAYHGMVSRRRAAGKGVGKSVGTLFESMFTYSLSPFDIAEILRLIWADKPRTHLHQTRRLVRLWTDDWRRHCRCGPPASADVNVLKARQRRCQRLLFRKTPVVP